MSPTGNVFGVDGKKCTSFLVGDVIGVVCNAHATNSTARGALGEGDGDAAGKGLWGLRLKWCEISHLRSTERPLLVA